MSEFDSWVLENQKTIGNSLCIAMIVLAIAIAVALIMVEWRKK